MSGGPPGDPGWVGRPTVRSERGGEVHPRFGRPSVGTGGVGRPTQKTERGREALLEVRE